MTGPSRCAVLRHALIAVGMLAAPPAIAAGCADHLHMVVESGSVRAAARPERIEEPALEALRQAAGARFKEAANAMCATGTLPAARMKALRQVVAMQASACTDACVVSDDRQFGPGTLLLQYIYAEAKLAPPPRAEVEAALGCWARADCVRGD